MSHLQKLYKSLKLVCQSFNDNLCGKLVSSLEFLIKFDEIQSYFSSIIYSRF